MAVTLETPREESIHNLSDSELNDLAYKEVCAKMVADFKANPQPPMEWNLDNIRKLTNDQKRVLAKALRLNDYFVEHIESLRHVGFMFPKRTKDSLVFDRDSGAFILGSKKKVVTTRNINHLQTIARIMWFNNLVMGLLNEADISTLRGVYYLSMKEKKPNLSFEVTKPKHEREGPIAAASFVSTMESLYGVPHELFGILPQERGSIFGSAEMEYTYPPNFAGKRFRLDAVPEGMNVGPSLTSANIISCDAERVIVVEKGEIFKKMVAKGLHEKYHAILVDSAGTGSSGTKLLVKKFVDQFKFRAYLVVDADPWGLHIARTWMVGSAKNGHLRTAIPTAKFLGATARDIVDYNLPPIRLDDRDKHRVQTLLEDPRYNDPVWHQYLLDYQRLGQKQELQAFTVHGLGFFTDTYLPSKMEAADR